MDVTHLSPAKGRLGVTSCTAAHVAKRFAEYSMHALVDPWLRTRDQGEWDAKLDLHLPPAVGLDQINSES